MLHILKPFLTYNLKSVTLSKLLNRSLEANIREKLSVVTMKRGKRNGISVDFIQKRYVCVRKTDMHISHLHSSFENAFWKCICS